MKSPRKLILSVAMSVTLLAGSVVASAPARHSAAPGAPTAREGTRFTS